jgi:hypothetical protein
MKLVFGGRLFQDSSLFFRSLLTDHRQNQSIGNENEFLSDPGETLRDCCEMGYGGLRVQVEVRRQLIISGGQVIDAIGVGSRCDESRFVRDESLASHTLGNSKKLGISSTSELVSFHILVKQILETSSLDKDR